MRSLLFVVGAWVAALVTNLTPDAALASGTTTAAAGNTSATASPGDNATSMDAGSTITAAAPPGHSTPWPALPTDLALPLVIGGLCALTLAAMGAGALLHRCCRRCTRRRQNVSSVSA
ncbi:US5 [Papiine alphaherpesvirus 2]|uniref:Glycoprotein J n=1 Tax=Cercopithecine herpesvirus 16 TaxID=340907 RepID=Q2QBB2_CHV16|nr:envelope glycoprotein J [Papiine alphaherpesvirus 2]UYB79381.1 envelope glycoprotein J [synthetic construct]AAW78007.1 glycoprotein J [Papiine alphaherpesvirus 2]ABA29318.1 US5 [Papiine alphaherpesvirus 2]ABJ91129.1 glycoprotein J [Papiine alphaherpesvirus 2]ABJ91132.1 glycoprotein J [Papiine alphaherpesvirus 2]